MYFRLVNKLEGFTLDHVATYFKKYSKNEFDIFVIGGFKNDGGVSLTAFPMQIITLADGAMKYDFNLDIRSK